jgi:uncharacterized LabA/DUF88 family protein
VDGQNLFYAARQRFGHSYPNYDVLKLARKVVEAEPDRVLTRVHFYTGLHAQAEDPYWHGFWSRKILAMKHAGIEVFHKPLKYAEITVPLPGGGSRVVRRGREKGVDVRMALDIVRMARRQEYDLAIVFSQDTDLEEAVHEVYEIRRELGIWLKFECAFPVAGTPPRQRGLDNTQWRPIDRATYDQCLDPADYRPPVAMPPPPPQP